MKIQFHGAAQTVTGSRFLVTSGKTRVLVDCGLFQGFKHLRLHNWDPFPVDLASLDAVILTHAHLDHSGYVPLLVKNGFRGPIYTTSATRDLCSILLPDSGYLQEEEANYANKRGYSKHTPAQPLYTQKDAEESLKSFKVMDWETRYSINNELEFEFHHAGHLFGASSVRLLAHGRSIAFSGDLGRQEDPLMPEPKYFEGGDAMVVESTYGNRSHPPESPEDQLGEVILRTINRGGTIVIPSFAVGRAQLVMYYIRRLKDAGKIPQSLPVFLNSPMAARANEVFLKHAAESKLSMEEATAVCKTAHVISSVEESIEVNARKGPKVLIAASGMATGGRVLHHLKSFAPDPRNSIVFVGYQAGGTRGDSIVHGAKEVKIHGEYWPIRAEVMQFDTMSAHADGDELIDWLRKQKKRPRKIFVAHGEPEAADNLRRRIQDELKIDAIAPEQGQEFDF